MSADSGAGSSALTIRQARGGDSGAVIDLNNHLAVETEFMVLLPIDRDYGTPLLAQRLEQAAADGSWMVLLAERQGAVVGMAMATPDANPRYRGVVEVEVGVRQNAWGHGIGKALFLELERQFRGRGARRLQLRVMAHNTRAIALYERLGYQHEGRLRSNVVIQGGYGDQLLMGKLL